MGAKPPPLNLSGNLRLYQVILCMARSFSAACRRRTSIFTARPPPDIVRVPVESGGTRWGRQRMGQQDKKARERAALFKAMGVVTVCGLDIAVLILIGILVGAFVDGRLHSSPWG